MSKIIAPRFKITGIDRSGKRFVIRTNSEMIFHGTNLYRGTKWIYNPATGCYRLFARVY